jgi:DnaK suppressor protein
MDSVKEVLERKRQALTEAIQLGVDRTRRAADRNELCREMSKDPYGSASLIHDDEIVADVADRRLRELQAVNRALEDVDAGRYGICQECGEAIAAARLRAMPFATRCVPCQAALEDVGRAA